MFGEETDMKESRLQEEKKEIKEIIESTKEFERKSKMTAREIFHHVFSIREDVASHEQIKETMVNGGELTGTNMCVLVLAILIASIGLNMNSTAVIIGAMLVSPLMGTIHAMAYAVASVDKQLLKNAAIGFSCQMFISLLASTIYFRLSPISDTTSELLARTQPTIWDVLIAVCGGLAGIIGITRKEKSNVIPGVAIATALMPPLCTCGYSIANGQWTMLLGAGYLFFVNTYFIFLSATIILMILDVPKVKEIDLKRYRRIKSKIIRNTIIVILPSLVVAWFMVNGVHAEDANLDTIEETVSVEVLTKEIEILFPEVDVVQIGSVEEVNADDRIVEKKVIILNKTGLKKSDADKLNEWIREKYTNYEIVYIPS